MKMLDINAKDILFALGYRNTDINGSILEIAEETAEECRNLMDQQYTDRMIKIDRVENGSVLLESGDALCFAPLAQALSGCSHVVMVLATMGSKIDDKIQSCSSSGDPLKAMMCDAFGTMARS